LFTKTSQEGVGPGLGYIAARTEKFAFSAADKKLKIPHMGWNTVSLRKESKLFSGLEKGARFYFVHSYHLVCDDSRDAVATTNHGYDFVSAVEHDNILGVQFHPEKSHKFGMRLLKNFAELY
jgi:glutamine amidotransferase